LGYFLGIDIGSRVTKGVLIEGDKTKAYKSLPSGINYSSTAQRLKQELLAEAAVSPEEILYIVATGFGAQSVTFSQQQSDDLRCCARGINFTFPQVRTVIDIGGTSSRVIRVDENGRIINFAISEKCAAGSGYFMEILANVLRVELQDIGPLSLKAHNPVSFTTGCAVFNESEAICMVSEGFSKEDILAGAHKALATKLSGLINRVGLEKSCAICGGGGLDIGLIEALKKEVEIDLLVPDQPQMITALGAALIARRIVDVGR
jgi:predicted CoA-substrate-specific enzyme activase